MKELYDNVALNCSIYTTRTYSTSFSLGIRLLHKRLRDAIYAIYGFVRLADEIVDTFHAYDQKSLLERFEQETYHSLAEGISLNPILQSFQMAVHQYNIDIALIDTFLHSMKMDLEDLHYNDEKYKEYILGSAEVVGLMCLHVFTEGNNELYEKLKPSAMRLGAAFQKINFLRDIKHDSEVLGRMYFPSVNFNNFSDSDKLKIEKNIEEDFHAAVSGIIQLPITSRMGVFLAYAYYVMLFKKIQKVPAHNILNTRIRVNNMHKIWIAIKSYLQIQLKWI
jgi:phytoene/squalene synthetase